MAGIGGENNFRYLYIDVVVYIDKVTVGTYCRYEYIIVNVDVRDSTST